MPARFKDLCLDAVDHQRMADWWCRCLGYRRRADPARPSGDPVLIEDPTGVGPAIWVNPVGETKTVKNRMHIDVVGDADALVEAGAVMLRPRDDGRVWDVLADPEGNEFCVFGDD